MFEKVFYYCYYYRNVTQNGKLEKGWSICGPLYS